MNNDTSPLEDILTDFETEHDVIATTARAELARLQRIEVERNEWRRALQSLTPGGSEFTEPHECVAYVRGRETTHWDLLKKVKRERDTLAAALDARP